MKRGLESLWAAVGLGAVVVAGYLLFRELRGHSPAEIVAAVRAISPARWLMATLSAILAYAALAWYDQIALMHIGRRLNWRFVGLVSFTTYAIAHNVGATVFTAALVRYRAYSTKGLSAAEVGLIVAFASVTFALGAMLLGGLTLLLEPTLIRRWVNAPPRAGELVAAALLIPPWFYLAGSLLHFRPLKIGGFSLVYPRPPVAARQMLVGPVELIGAAGVLYFAWPPEANPGFVVLLGVFLAAFTVSLVSHAPGGLGVLEYGVLKSMPDTPPTDVLAALLVFRLLYLIVPLLISVVIVTVFERRRFALARMASADLPPPG